MIISLKKNKFEFEFESSVKKKWCFQMNEIFDNLIKEIAENMELFVLYCF